MAANNISNKGRKPSTKTPAIMSDDEICGDCKHLVTDSGEGVQCEICEYWFHAPCQKLNKTEYGFLMKQKGISQFHWYCDRCNKSAAGMVSLISKIKVKQDQMNTRLVTVEDKVSALETQGPPDVNISTDITVEPGY